MQVLAPPLHVPFVPGLGELLAVRSRRQEGLTAVLLSVQLIVPQSPDKSHKAAENEPDIE